jgi:predicted GH43/DUF377 family glycosyl hydrolase
VSLRVWRRRLVSRGELPESGGGVFNPGAVLIGPSILLVCRREVDYRFTTDVHAECVLVDPETLAVVGHRTLSKGSHLADRRIEDFRCFVFDGMLLVVHSLVDPHRIKPVISRVVGDCLEPFDDFDLPIEIGPIEKNWVLFERGGALHCLYKLDPLTVFVRTEPRSWQLVKEEENGWAEEVAQTLSNSTNLIPFRGGHLGFWHTILQGGRYVQGAYFLGRDLDIEYRTDVLLDGADIPEGHKPGVLYVSSILQHRGRILAFFGEADTHTSVAVFDGAELWDELVRSPFRIVDAVRIRYEGTSTGDLFRAMRALQKFSERRGNPRIRLYVRDLRVRPVIELFKIPSLVVYAQGRRRHYDYEFHGQTVRPSPTESSAASPI